MSALAAAVTAIGVAVDFATAGLGARSCRAVTG